MKKTMMEVIMYSVRCHVRKAISPEEYRLLREELAYTLKRDFPLTRYYIEAKRKA